MHFAKRVALAAAVLLISSGLSACKKDDKKKDEPAAKPDDKGSGTGAASGTAKEEKKEGAEAALQGIKGAMASAKTGGTGGATAGMGLGGGGIGARLGGLFGGGAPAAAAETPTTGQDPARHAAGKGQDPSAVAVDEGEGDQPPTQPDELASIKWPPAGELGGGCDKVTERLVLIMTQVMEHELKDLPADQRAMVDKEIASQKATFETELLKMCTEQNWPQALKDCALTAMSEADFETCEQYVTPEMEAAMEKDEGEEEYEPGEDYPAEPAKPVPAWTGGSDCAAVGERMMQLATAQMGDIPADYKAEFEASLKEQAAVMAEMCTEAQWDEAMRKCILGAATIDAAGECLGEM